jgi:hypothetical protein
MRFFKLAIISAIVLFIIVTAISSLLPSKVLVSRAIDIQAPIPVIKAQVFRLNNWQHWMSDAKGEKAKIDSIEEQGISIGETQIHVSSANDSTCYTTWSGKTNMTGTFNIIDHHRPDSVITVQWQMEQKVKWYPWEKFASITKDELWGGSMEKSLDNLKKLVEAR